MRWAILAAALLAVPLAPASGASDLLRLEGEARTRDAGVCTGGESIAVWSVPHASGGSVLALLNEGCWAEWDVHLDVPAREVAVQGYNNGGASECFAFDLHVDGVLAGTTSSLCGGVEGGALGLLRVLNGNDPATLSAGDHVLRLTQRVTGGASWLNAAIDFLEVTPAVPGCDATNRAPAAPGAPEAPGMGNPRTYLWGGFAYPFTAASSSDPDGDPVRHTWSWGDGSSEAGDLSAEHTFADTGGSWRRTVTVTATDDPSARDQPGCPPLRPASASAARNFQVHPDFSYRWVGPFPGDTCAAGQRAPTGVQAIAGPCSLRVSISPNPRQGEEVTSVYDHTDFLLDGAFYARSASSPWEATAAYDSLQHPRLTPSSLQACIHARNDLHARVFCGPAFDFVNV